MPKSAEQLKTRLADLVRQRSVSCLDPRFDMSNVGVADTLSNWLEDAGFTVTRQEVCAEPEKVNVLARLGAGEGGLVLSGHLDTVPYDEQRWDTDPFELVERDGRWYGLGSADMKCFFPVVLAALDGFDTARLNKPVTVIATADEESSMAGARTLMQSGERLGDYAIIGEPTNLVPIRKHKGIMIGRIDVTGRSGHSSDPSLGANALDAMHDIISGLKAWRSAAAERFRDTDFRLPVPTLNLGRISGGDSPNRICASCELFFDVRTMPGMNAGATVAELETVVQDAIAGAGLDAELVMTMTPLEPMQTAADSAIVRAAETLAGAKAETVAFATEGPFLNALGCETVVMGPGDIDTAHQPNEFVPVDKVHAMTGIVRSMIGQFCCDD